MNLNKKKKLILILLILTNIFLCQCAEEEHHDEEKEQHENGVMEEKQFDYTVEEAWQYGILATFGVGCLGFLCSVFVILLKTYSTFDFNIMLKVLIAFAAGTLLGDSFVHIIPENFNGTEAQKKMQSLLLCLGVFSFFLIERVMVVFGIAHSHGVDDDQCVHTEHAHGHDHIGPNKNIQENGEGCDQQHQGDCIIHQEEVQQQKEKEFDLVIDNNNNQENKQPEIQKDSPQKDVVDLAASNVSIKETKIKTEKKRSEGYQSLVGDFLHNVLDGIAIGGIFALRNRTGAISTIIAIVAHEIPQEVGIVSILINSKFSNKETLLWNSIVQFSSIIGAIIGLKIGSMDKFSSSLMGQFIAGNFIYIGAVDMMPLLNKEKGKIMFLAQCIALLVGFGVMFLVLLAEPEHGEEEEH